MRCGGPRSNPYFSVLQYGRLNQQSALQSLDAMVPHFLDPSDFPFRSCAKARRLPAFSRQAEPGQGRRPGDPDCLCVRTGAGRRGEDRERAGGPGLGSRNFAGTSGETILIFKGHGPRENRYYVARNQEDIRHARRAQPRMAFCRCARACL